MLRAPQRLSRLAGASDYLPNPIWANVFLKAQGYPIAERFFEHPRQQERDQA